MFDNQNNSNSEPPQNLPFQPDDILASTEKDSTEQIQTPVDALEVGLLKKKSVVPPVSSSQVFTPPAMPEQQSVSYDVKKPILGKIITIVIILCIVGGLAFAGWWVYSNFFINRLGDPLDSSSTATDIGTSPTTTPPTVTPTSSDSENSNNNEILFGEQTDSDKDNLDDRRERELLTNPTKSDTDEDGLNDGDEVLIWKTDPLKPDTDDDGYKDGEEVRNGYNPRGAGKLLQDTSASSTVQSTSTL